jgi:hypothetical protein
MAPMCSSVIGPQLAKPAPTTSNSGAEVWHDLARMLCGPSVTSGRCRDHP